MLNLKFDKNPKELQKKLSILIRESGSQIKEQTASCSSYYASQEKGNITISDKRKLQK